VLIDIHRFCYYFLTQVLHGNNAMEKFNFTGPLVAGYKCKKGKQQSIYWDAKTPGLGLRVTANNAKSYVFQTNINGKTIRITIGDPRAWKLGDAQTEATRLKRMTDKGLDPRQVESDKLAQQQAEANAKKAQQVRESLTVSAAWNDYIEARKDSWGVLHLADHHKAMHQGGEARKRSKALTVPGILASFAPMRLVELTPDKVQQWAKKEGAARQTSARKGQRLLSAFLVWCVQHPIYGAIVSGNVARNSEAKRHLGKPKDGALEKEQLKGWFNAVKQIGNPVISHYLQTLLLTGARPNEIASVRWDDVDFQWDKMTINDKVEGLRVIPLTPYVKGLLVSLPRRNGFVFGSTTSASGHIERPTKPLAAANLIAGVDITFHDLRRSFASLSEWIEMPAGIAAQIQGHKPSGVREKNYIRRTLDLLRMWHVKIEAWILEQAGIELVPVQIGLRVVA
jgi:integrase